MTLTGTNAYTISISSTDADVSAEDLSTIDGKTTERIDAGAVTSISGTYSQISSLLSSNGIYALGAVDLNVDDDLSVSQANALDNLTTGSITANIGSARVSDLLRSLSDDNSNNAYTITISEEDATGLTATQLNEINELSSQPVDASAVTALSYDTIANINTLLTSGLDSSQFTETSFSELSSVSVFDETGYFEVNTDVANALGTETGVGLNHYIKFGQNEGRNDGSIDVEVLNNALNSGYTLSPTVVFTLTSGSTIQGGEESDFIELLDHEDDGTIEIINQNLTVENGTVSASIFDELEDTTTGTVTVNENPPDDGSDDGTGDGSDDGTGDGSDDGTGDGSDDGTGDDSDGGDDGSGDG